MEIQFDRFWASGVVLWELRVRVFMVWVLSRHMVVQESGRRETLTNEGVRCVPRPHAGYCFEPETPELRILP